MPSYNNKSKNTYVKNSSDSIACMNATAAFTLDVYGHVTDQMKRESADRMQQYINRIKKSG